MKRYHLRITLIPAHDLIGPLVAAVAVCLAIGWELGLEVAIGMAMLAGVDTLATLGDCLRKDVTPPLGEEIIEIPLPLGLVQDQGMDHGR